MNLYEPKVSIVIPAYKASNYLAEAIDCALAQTYPNIEIIVVNDGSPDDGATAAVAARYAGRIRYFEKENGGSSSALNRGIREMTGEWFSWLSHDDLYLPEKVEREIALLRALNIPASERFRHVFFSAHDLIDGEGKTIQSPRMEEVRRFAQTVNSVPHNGYLIAEPTVYTFHGCSCLVHRDAFGDVGGFDESLRLLNDLDLWYRIYSAGYHIHYVPEVLVRGRIHGAQVSKSIGYSYHNPEQDMFWSRSLEWLMRNHPEEGELLYRFGRNAYLKTRNAEGDRAFARLTAAAPSRKTELAIKKRLFKLRAGVRNFAKEVYLKIRG